MPKMEWAQFQRDHHRPHLLVVSVAARKASDPPTEAPDLERLAVRLGAAGNYAFRVEGTTLFATFEDDGDAERLAQVFRPKQITREREWTMAPLSEESRTSSEAHAYLQFSCQSRSG